MAYEYYVETAVNCVFICHTGDFVLGDAARSLAEAVKMPKFKAGTNILRDMRQTKFSREIDYQSIKRFENDDFKEAKRIIGNAKLAWVVGDRDDYILTHQLVVSERLEISELERKPFRDIEKAKEWLGIPEDYEIVFPSKE